MFMADVSIDKFDDRVALGLGQVLWSWQCCDDCQANRRCQSTVCSSYIPQAKRYLQYYEALVLDYHDELPLDGQPFKTHGDIWKAISLLTSRPQLTRAEFSDLISAPSLVPVNHNLLRDATALVVKISCMTDCSSLYYSPGRLEDGKMGLVWANHTPFDKYLQDLFTTQNHPVWSSQYGQSEVLHTRRSRMRATKLKKHLNLTICPTHEIRDHLRLDTRRNEIKVFHYASFLKANLKAKRKSSAAYVFMLLDIQYPALTRPETCYPGSCYSKS